jgi:hypothetical protein
MHPGESHRSLWQRIYPVIIEDHDSLNKLERQAAEQELHDRVRWRRRVQKRAARQV